MSTVRQLAFELKKLCDEGKADYEVALDLRGLLQLPHNMPVSLSDECERFDLHSKIAYVTARLREQ